MVINNWQAMVILKYTKDGYTIAYHKGQISLIDDSYIMLGTIL